MHRRFTLGRTIVVLLTTALLGVCLLPLGAQSRDFAKVIFMQGDVRVIRGAPVALFKDWTVRPKETIVTGPDGYAQFQITDGSTFEVFANSQVVFHESFGLGDLVQVMLGKIRVQVEHRNGPNPKKVSTPTAVISVRGTVFDVTVEDADGTTLVSVEEGLVGVKHQLQPGDEKLLRSNESVRIFPNSPLARARNSQGGKIVLDAIKRAGTDVVMNNPGGAGRVPTGTTGTTGAQGDQGKKKGGTGAGGGPGGGPGAPPGG
jgi:hypothetical protein